MSDGPHKSLPLKHNWQRVAEHADNLAFEVDEIIEALMLALERDCRDEVRPGLIDRIRGMIEERGTLLIEDDLGARFAAMQTEVGPGIGQRFIEHCARIYTKDLRGIVDVDKAMTSALTDALVERAARRNRQIEEHYLRKSTASRANHLRARLEQATERPAIERLARQILKLDNNSPPLSYAKRDGLDEGPKIR